MNQYVTRQRFENYRKAFIEFKRSIHCRKNPIYEPKSLHLGLIESKCAAMQYGWHEEEKEDKNMPTTVTNEHLRKEFENFERNEDLEKLLDELRYSTLIAPMDADRDAFSMITMAGELYIPLFTDIHEYRKVDFKSNFRPAAFEFNFYIEILQRGDIGGFIVNVESERFPITGIFLDFVDTDYRFDLDYRPFTEREIQEIHDSIDNRELEDFLSDESGRWDYDTLMELLLKSDLLSVTVSKENPKKFTENSAISVLEIENPTYYRTRDNYTVLFSSTDKINITLEGCHLYSVLVNLGIFIDFVLKSDLEGIVVDGDVVVSRDYLIDFMNGFSTPSLDKYDDWMFLI